jgi:hypothetical protein
VTRRQLAAINATAKAIEERDTARAAFREYRRAMRGRLGTARAILAAVDALHTKDGPACTCGLTWPCPTRRALDGGR